MEKMISFSSLVYENKKRKTRREKFLEEMDQVVPWEELLKITRKRYPKKGNGRQPMPLEQMLADWKAAVKAEETVICRIS